MTAPALASGITAETLAAISQALARGSLDADALAKATTTQGFSSTTAIEGYNLEAPSKSLFPVLSPLRNRIPRVTSKGGSAVHWKAITAINAAKLKAAVAEGVRNAVVSTTTEDKLQAYKSFGLDDSVTFEAQINARGFQDVRATSQANLLSAVMIEEEKLILGGNVTDIGKPASITAADTAADGSGSLTAATTYYYGVSALTLYGYLNGAAGRIGGTTDSPDESDARTGNHATTASGAGSDAIALSWPAVRGAAAYNVFAGATSTLKYVATVTANAYTLLAIPGSGDPANTADQTGDALAFDGIIPQIAAATGGAYFKDLAGATLTSDNAGGIVEIDAMLKSLYDNARISPTAILVSSQESRNMALKVAIAASTTQVQLIQQVGADGTIQAGLTLTYYRNPYFGGRPIPVITHPFHPAGLIQAIAEQLPYANTNVPNPFELDVAQEYTSYDWALVQRKYEFGIYGREALKVYFPAGCGVIAGIGNG